MSPLTTVLRVLPDHPGAFAQALRTDPFRLAARMADVDHPLVAARAGRRRYALPATVALAEHLHARDAVAPATRSRSWRPLLEPDASSDAAEGRLTARLPDGWAKQASEVAAPYRSLLATHPLDTVADALAAHLLAVLWWTEDDLADDALTDLSAAFDLVAQTPSRIPGLPARHGWRLWWHVRDRRRALEAMPPPSGVWDFAASGPSPLVQAFPLLARLHAAVATLLSFGTYLLCARPAVAARLRAEAETLGAAEDREAPEPLPHLRRALLETLRLYPPDWLRVRRLAAEIALEDVRLRAGTRLLFSAYHLHRDPACWRHPHAFDPDRFAAPPPPKLAFAPLGTDGAARTLRDFALWLVEPVMVAWLLDGTLTGRPLPPIAVRGAGRLYHAEPVVVAAPG